MPKLSAIIPTTKARLPLLPLAIERFFGQQNIDHADVELIVGSEDQLVLAAVANAFPNQPIKTISTTPGLTLGEKRNEMVTQAEAAWVTHWDDDDWSSSDRLQRTLDAIEQADRRERPIIGSPTMMIHEIVDPRRRTFVYRYQRPLSGGYPAKYLVGGTITYRKELWVETPFGKDATGEESWWQIKLYDKYGVDIIEPLYDSPYIYVAFIHTINAANKQASIGDPSWTLWTGDLSMIMGNEMIARYEQAHRMLKLGG